MIRVKKENLKSPLLAVINSVSNNLLAFGSKELSEAFRNTLINSIKTLKENKKLESKRNAIKQSRLPEVVVFPKNELNNVVSKVIKGAGHAIRKPFNNGEDFDPEIIDLNNKYLRLVDINSEKNKNKLIIGSYFVETENPNMVGTPKSFYKGQRLGDRQIPIENFHLWMGFENGRLKVYPDVNQFDENTLITPVRNKSLPITGPIDNNYNFGVRNSFIIYQGDGRNARKVLVLKKDRANAINDYVKTYNVNEKDPAYLIMLDSGRYSHNTTRAEDYGYDLPRTDNIWGIRISDTGGGFR